MEKSLLQINYNENVRRQSQKYSIKMQINQVKMLKFKSNYGLAKDLAKVRLEREFGLFRIILTLPKLEKK